MAGYSRLYCVGGAGGFMGSDGINPLLFQILVGDADRQWLQVLYVHKNIKPLAGIRKIIPAGPDHPSMVLDACIVFFPAHFQPCSLLPKAEKELQGLTTLDLHLGPVPQVWSDLRLEARPYFAQLGIWEARFVPVSFSA